MFKLFKSEHNHYFREHYSNYREEYLRVIRDLVSGKIPTITRKCSCGLEETREVWPQFKIGDKVIA